MPYITPDQREKYDGALTEIEDIINHLSIQQVAGEFTYIVYRLLKRFNVSFFYRALGIGCMVCVILEMYRQEHSRYEDIKKDKNGGV